MTIQVTQEDIDNGTRDEPFCCPVALATKRATGRHIGVGTKFITVFLQECGDDRHAVDFPASREVTAFVKSFDNKYAVQPFEFELPYEVNS